MNERERLTGFILGVVDYLRSQDQDGSLDSTAKGIRESLNRRGPLTGLRQAASDMVEWCQNHSQIRVSELDASLQAAGCPTLTQMRDSRFRKLQTLLAQDKLRSNTQYQLLESFLADTADAILSKADRERANQMLVAYHAR